MIVPRPFPSEHTMSAAVAQAESSAASTRVILKLDSAGEILPADATSWSAVRVLDGSLRIDILTGNIGGRSMSHRKAVEACANIDAIGSTDWRLWTPAEAFALVDHARFNPAVDTALFPDIKPDWYWTSSPGAEDPDGYAWIVHFHYGDVYLYHRGYNAFVRAVRSVPASQ
ncbi:MAG: DUF1566 domain-containing protein [Dokdonella sp.]|nr:DUF1566 domain-containing protein [Dokdonella sp.]